MKVRDWLNAGTEKLKNAGVENAEYDARMLLMAAYGMDSAGFLSIIDRDICPGAAGGKEPERDGGITECPGDCGAKVTYDMNINMRARRVPLQQILGKTWFMGLEFIVTRDVLCPRPDTETLCETVLQQEKDKDISILDMCTGSGCIAVSLKKLGDYERTAALDISRDALTVALRNASKNKVDIDLYEGDVYSPHGEPSSVYKKLDEETKFDVIVSNPPYINSDVIPTLEPEVKDHDPVIALDGGEDGLTFYRKIIEGAPKHLNPKGRIYFEIGYDQAESVSELLKSAGFHDINVIKDLAGLDRVVYGRL